MTAASAGCWRRHGLAWGGLLLPLGLSVRHWAIGARWRARPPVGPRWHASAAIAWFAGALVVAPEELAECSMPRALACALYALRLRDPRCFAR